MAFWGDYYRLPMYVFSGQPGKYFAWKLHPLVASIVELTWGRKPETGERTTLDDFVRDFALSFAPGGADRMNEGEMRDLFSFLTTIETRPGSRPSEQNPEAIRWAKDPENQKLLTRYLGHKPNDKELIQWLPVIGLPPHEAEQALANVFSQDSIAVVRRMLGRSPTKDELADIAPLLAQNPDKRDETIQRLYDPDNLAWLQKALGRKPTGKDIFKYWRELLLPEKKRRQYLGKGAETRKREDILKGGGSK